jgi:hypothetical protein
VITACAGASALAFVWVCLRYGPQVLHELLTMVAGITAIVSNDDKRRESCYKVLDTIARRDSEPPRPPRRRGIGRARSGG